MENDQNNQNTQGVPSVENQISGQQPQVENVQNQPQNLQQPQAPNTPSQTQNPTQPETTGLPPSSKTKRSNIILKVGLIFLVIAVAIGGLTFFSQNQEKNFNNEKVNTTPKPTQSIKLKEPSPTPNPMANWKGAATNYYTIKYPNDLDLKTEREDVLVLSKWGPTQIEATELFDGYSIAIQPIETTQTPQSYANTLISDIENVGVGEIIEELEPIIINNYEGFTFTEEGLGTYKQITLNSNDSSVLIQISIIVSDPGNLGFQETVDQILSTFEFIQGI